MVFLFRQLQNKCWEQNKKFFITSSTWQMYSTPWAKKGMEQVMGTLICAPQFLNMVIQLNENQCGQARFNNNNHLSEPFLIINAVKQGCILAPNQSSIFFSMIWFLCFMHINFHGLLNAKTIIVEEQSYNSNP